MKHVRGITVAGLLVLALHLTLRADDTNLRGGTDHAGVIEAMVNATGINSGYLVHLGCGTGELTAALRLGDSCFVHGLDADREKIARAKENIMAAGIYGSASVQHFDGRRLPYVDRLVNLVLVEKSFALPESEIRRVLAPGGKAYFADSGAVLPRELSTETDEWPQYPYNAQGTMVSNDDVVGPPRHIQWSGGPKWLRNHEFMASMHAMVSGGGKIFYIIDEGLGQHIYLPPRWNLVARDAYNGKVLWKRSLKDWHPHNWPMKSGPAHLPRRLAYQDGRVYVTTGFIAPVSVLDAATGKTVRSYEDTFGAEEILLSGSTLYVLADPQKKPFHFRETTTSWVQAKSNANARFGWIQKSPERMLVAIDINTGNTLWKRLDRVAPLSLTAGEKHVFFCDGEAAVAFDGRSGNLQWRTPLPDLRPPPLAGYAFRVVHSDNVVLFNVLSNVWAVSATDGTLLWHDKIHKTGHMSPSDLFVINGKIWSAKTGPPQTQGTEIRVIDIKTGAEVESFIAESPEAYFMHQRCYMGRATRKYLMTSGTGTEFYEIGSRSIDLNHHVRGSCIYGVMPSDGMLIKPPDSCACYYQSKVAHFMALCPEQTRTRNTPVAEEERLEKGPAYGRPGTTDRDARSSGWITLRSDTSRSGYTARELPENLVPGWQAAIGSKLSAATSADGRVFVASIDAHTVYCLDATDGSTLWTFTADGRIDSPPTLHRGMALFGAADGYVYCLDASDGKLMYRYLVAFNRDKHAAYQQLESVWPMHGSVLVRDGNVYCLAGRNMLFDGGMRLVRLEAATGKLISETMLGENIPGTDRSLRLTVPRKHMPVANPDILSCDDRFVYMGAQKFDLDGKRLDIDTPAHKEYDQLGEGRHLFCPTGLLDDRWFHRSYMIYGKTGGEGHNEYPMPRRFTSTGRLVVVGPDSVFSFRVDGVGNTMHPRTSTSVVCEDKNVVAKKTPVDPNDAQTAKKRRKHKGPNFKLTTKIDVKWKLEAPGLLASSMVLTGNTLVLAGPPDLADEEKMHGFLPGADDEINKELKAQDAAWRGEAGGVLLLVSAKDGKKLATYKTDSIPVWDGMAVSEDTLFIPMKDGTVAGWKSR